MFTPEFSYIANQQVLLIYSLSIRLETQRGIQAEALVPEVTVQAKVQVNLGNAFELLDALCLVLEETKGTQTHRLKDSEDSVTGFLTWTETRACCKLE